MKYKILITSAGSGVSQNVLETLIGRRKDLYIIGTDVSPDTPLYHCDKVYLLPPTERPPSDFATELTKIIHNESPDLIIPGRDIDVIILSMMRDQFPEIRNRFLAGSTALAEMMEDKWLSYQFSKSESLPFAETIQLHPSQEMQELVSFTDTFGYPMIRKPNKGYASKGVSLILNSDQLKKTEINESIILQEYLGPVEEILRFEEKLEKEGIPLFYSLEEEKFSLQLFIDYKGALSGAFVTSHKMVNGVSTGVFPLNNVDFEHLIAVFWKAFAKNGWYGPLNIQLQRSHKDGQLKAYEYNGRFTGATAARYFLGYDEFGLAMKGVIGKEFNKDMSYGSQQGVIKQSVVSRIPENHARSLEKEGTWLSKDPDQPS